MAREMVLAGIEDAQGTIHANDSKCSAALITHGLLFAGVVTVTAEAAKLYPEAHGALPILALCLVGLAAAAFMVSIVALLFAVMPYRPKALMAAIDERNHSRQIFFPPSRDRCLPIPSGNQDPVLRQLAAVAALDERAATLELVAESVKLAAVRDHEASLAKVGYVALIVEVALVVAYLGLVGAVAITASA